MPSLTIPKKTLQLAWVPWVLMSALLLLAVSLQRGIVLDFLGTDGDLQNWNPVHRLIQGQRIGADFDPYLGWLLSYVMFLVTLVFGPNFAGSKIAAYLLSSGSFVFIAALGLYWGGMRLRTSLFYPTLLVFLYSLPDVQIIIYRLLEMSPAPSGAKPLRLLLSHLTYIDPGTSLRTVRPVCLFVSFALLIGLESHLHRSNGKSRPLMVALAGGVLAGFCALWSTDYGLPASLATLALTVLLAQYRSPIFPDFKSVFLTGILGASTAFTTFYLASFSLSGRWDAPLIYFGYLKDISETSYWYFDVSAKKAYSWNTLHWARITLECGACALSLYLFLKKKKITFLATSLALACLVTSGTLASIVNVNQVDNFRDSILFGFFWVAGLGIHHFTTALQKRLPVHPAPEWPHRIMAIVMAVIVSLSWTEWWHLHKGVDARLLLANSSPAPTHPAKMTEFWHSRYRAPLISVPELGGYLSTAFTSDVKIARSLRDTENVKSLWCSYGGFYDTLIGTRNSLRTDYLIHALGPKNEERVISHLIQHPPDRIITINPAYIAFESWLRAQNWHVYETLLLEGYEKVKETGMVFVWKKNNVSQAEIIPGGEAAVRQISPTESLVNMPQADRERLMLRRTPLSKPFYILFDIEYSALPKHHLLLKTHAQVEPTESNMGFGLETGSHVKRRIPFLYHELTNPEIRLKVRPSDSKLTIHSATWSLLTY
ncbi:MAG: hypothetical protein SFU85_13360 [Candidatus Methylacidiphilales bacterium]|nr:hypothetical protein [Candidatus Methylacidiphilales bacterium]